MNRCRIGRGLVSILALAAIIASCGGSDSDSENGAAPGSTAAEESADAAEDEATSDDAAAEDETSTSEADESEADSDDDESESGDTTTCDAIFSLAEMEEFFAEPVELTEESDDDLGQLVCTWESIEDPDDMEDLAFQLLIVQFYSGSPIEASAFFDPAVLGPVTTIEGIGDLAYVSDSTGMDFSFLDDPVGGSLSYTAVDMGNADAEPLHPPDEVEQLFRTFHERVT